MVIFHSYVSLPEGKSCYGGRFGNSEHFVAEYEGLGICADDGANSQQNSKMGKHRLPGKVGKMPGKWALKRVPTKV